MTKGTEGISRSPGFSETGQPLASEPGELSATQRQLIKGLTQLLEKYQSPIILAYIDDFLSVVTELPYLSQDEIKMILMRAEGNSYHFISLKLHLIGDRAKFFLNALPFPELTTGINGAFKIDRRLLREKDIKPKSKKHALSSAKLNSQDLEGRVIELYRKRSMTYVGYKFGITKDEVRKILEKHQEPIRHKGSKYKHHPSEKK